MNLCDFLPKLAKVDGPLKVETPMGAFHLSGIRIDVNYPTEKGALGVVKSKGYLQLSKEESEITPGQLHHHLSYMYTMYDDCFLLVEDIAGEPMIITSFDDNVITCEY